MRSKLRTEFGVTVALTVLVLGGFSESRSAGFSTAGVGLRARSMGGAFRGIASDWSAMAYNPAGLALRDQNELNLTLGTYSPQLTYTPSIAEGGVDIGYGAANGTELVPKDDVWPIPSFALAMKPSDKLNFAYGAAIYWPHDVNYQWDLFRQPLGYNSDYVFHAKKNFHTDLDVLDFHPTIAKSFGEKLSVGVGLAIQRGDVVYRRVLFVPNPLGDLLDDYPINNFYGDYRMEGNGVGFGANAGLFWQLSDALSLGVSGKTPVTIPMKGTAHINMAWPFNPARQQVEFEQYGRVRSFFRGVNNEAESEPSFFSNDYEYDLELPAEFGAGIGFTASDRLTLAFDLAMTFWSAVDAWDIAFNGDGLNVGVDTLASLSVPFGWDDQIRVSAGGEYMAKDDLAVRGGFYYDAGAAVDSTFTPNFPDVGDRIGITAGVSYTIQGKWELAAAQEVAFASERVVPSVGAADGITAFPGTYSLTRYETLLAVSYRF